MLDRDSWIAATESQISSIAAQWMPESLGMTKRGEMHRFPMRITENTPTITVSSDAKT